MDDAKRRLVAGWLGKAEEDIAVAELLIERESRLLGAGVYHCQQAAEKGLKAWLTCMDLVFPKTHDLEALLHLAVVRHAGFSVYAEHARRLTPLATEFRYPGDVFQPSAEEAREVMKLASDLLKYCQGQIPLEA